MNAKSAQAYSQALDALRAAGTDGITPRQYAKKLGHLDPVHAMKALGRIHALYPERIKTEWKAVAGSAACCQEVLYRYTEPHEDMLK